MRPRGEQIQEGITPPGFGAKSRGFSATRALPWWSTVAKKYYFLICTKHDKILVSLFPAYLRGKPEGFLPATVAADLHPYRTEVYHPIKWVIDASGRASTVEISIAEVRGLVNCSKSHQGWSTPPGFGAMITLLSREERTLGEKGRQGIIVRVPVGLGANPTRVRRNSAPLNSVLPSFREGSVINESYCWINMHTVEGDVACTPMAIGRSVQSRLASRRGDTRVPFSSHVMLTAGPEGGYNYRRGDEAIETYIEVFRRISAKKVPVSRMKLPAPQRSDILNSGERRFAFAVQTQIQT